ncbi:MAG: phage scaffolding protein [Symbiobacteriaceae bacterium]|nr:phage scaffolding protein [Symbiobacteriaceae bacterium]
MEWLRKMMQDQGITLTDEQFEAIKKAAPEHVIPKAQYNARSEEAEGLKAQLAQRDTDIAALKKGAGENEELKKQLNDLQAKYKTESDASAAELVQSRLTAAVDLALVTSGARSVKATKALLDMTKVKLDGEQLLGLGEQIEALRKEQGYLFAEATPPGTQTPPPGYPYQPQGGNPPPNTAPMTLTSVISEQMAANMAKIKPVGSAP